MEPAFVHPALGVTRYLCVLPDCHAKSPLAVDRAVVVKHLAEADVAAMCEQLRRRNVFARHAGGGFYTRVLAQMADRTVVELLVPGEPDHVAAEAAIHASAVEDVVLVAALMGLTRSAVAKRLRPRDPSTHRVELAIGPGFRQLRARSARLGGKAGAEIDAPFAKRFSKHGFTHLYRLCTSATDMGTRVRYSIHWLKEAVREANLQSAVIQLAIAMETMFIFSESESLARSLGERLAFLLTDDENMRASVDTAVKRFYDARSGVAHGSRRKLRHLSVPLVDGAARLAVLSLCVVGANAQIWRTPDSLRDWFARERWVTPSAIDRPFTVMALRRALSLCATEREVQSAGPVAP
jgi:hypothetical protein